MDVPRVPLVCLSGRSGRTGRRWGPVKATESERNRDDSRRQTEQGKLERRRDATHCPLQRALFVLGWRRTPVRATWV
jgi:hypothetical protein